MKILAGLSLLLVIVLVCLSAYLRLAHSGLGCLDWPACYGRIGHPPAASAGARGHEAASAGAYQQMLDQSAQPLSWATPLHRLVASVLGLLVLFLAILAIRRKRQRMVTLVLLALTVYLAVLGIRSGSLHDPAVVMGNLLGGFSMLGLLAWLWFQLERPVATTAATASRRVPGPLILTATLLLASQIVLGGLTSANFAATSCQTLPDCHGRWWPGPELLEAFDLSRVQQVTPSGQAIGGQERIAVHQAHRLGAVLTALLILLTGALAWRAGGRWRVTGALLCLLVVTEFGVGIAAILAELPILLAVAHNWLAGLLLVGLLRLATLDQQLRAGSTAH